MKRMFLALCILILVPLLYVGGNMLLAVITQFNPPPVLDVPVKSTANNPKIITDSVLTFMTWNVGYGGLGAEVDFFYDGGKMVTSPKELVQKYTQGIFDFAKQNKDVDFLFFQEVDQKGKRSWNINESAGLENVLDNHTSTFALNYDVLNLPFPWLDPMGRIYGGLQSFTKYLPVESKRYALDNITDFPRKLFYLKRCLLLQRFKVQNGKDLVVLNTHFEAYDNGEVKKKQMAFTKTILEAEYAKGNYVILGGDWNIAPPDFDIHKWEKEKETDTLYVVNNSPNYIPGWKYVYDGNTPSNRKNAYPFDPKRTFTTVIDYFFLSPNIAVEEIKGVDLGFRCSDHNPVKLKVRLN